MNDISEPILEEPLVKTSEQLLTGVVNSLQTALFELEVLVARTHPGASEWSRKLQRLINEVTGKRGTRQVSGSTMARTHSLEPIGPVVALTDWCEAMIQKITAFREEYEAARLDDADNFPAERTASDWSQELAMFVPSASQELAAPSPITGESVLEASAPAVTEPAAQE